jgi:plastocyanin
MRSKTFFFSSLVAVAGAVACSSTTSSPSTSNTADSGTVPDAGEADAGPTGPKTHAVDVGNFYYNPDKLTIKVGDSVKWTFSGGTHTVTSGKNCTKDGAFDTGTKDAPFTFERKFDAAGTVSYFCDYRTHCAMGQVGIITVEE